jgi:hypothetical protein
MDLLKQLQDKLKAASDKELELNKKLDNAFNSIEDEKQSKYNTPTQDSKLTALLEEKEILKKLCKAGQHLRK